MLGLKLIHVDKRDPRHRHPPLLAVVPLPPWVIKFKSDPYICYVIYVGLMVACMFLFVQKWTDCGWIALDWTPWASYRATVVNEIVKLLQWNEMCATLLANMEIDCHIIRHLYSTGISAPYYILICVNDTCCFNSLRPSDAYMRR